MPDCIPTQNQFRKPFDSCPMANGKSLGIPGKYLSERQQLNVNIHKLIIESDEGIFESRIQLYVHDVDDVNTICNNLKKIENIKKVTRIESFDDPAE